MNCCKIAEAAAKSLTDYAEQCSIMSGGQSIVILFQAPGKKVQRSQKSRNRGNGQVLDDSASGSQVLGSQLARCSSGPGEAMGGAKRWISEPGKLGGLLDYWQGTFFQPQVFDSLVYLEVLAH